MIGYKAYHMFCLILCMMGLVGNNGYGKPANEITICTSPDGKVKAGISRDNDWILNVYKNGVEVIVGLKFNIDVKPTNYQKNSMRITSVSKPKKINKIVKANFYTTSTLIDSYTTQTIYISDGWCLDLRIYDNAVAYRWNYLGVDEVCVHSEKFILPEENLSTVTYAYHDKGNSTQLESQLRSSFQNTYSVGSLNNVKNGKLIYLPILLKDEHDKTILFTEVNTERYPGLSLLKAEDGLNGYLAHYPKELKKGGSTTKEELVVNRYEFIAKFNGPQELPWRVFLLADEASDLILNHVPYLLATPSKIEDTSWIKPGMAIWDWWHNNNIYSVDFKVGMNSTTYKYYIDFASAYHIPYVLIDAGWYNIKTGNLFNPVQGFNLDEIVEYAKRKNVGIFLWTQHGEIADKIEDVAQFLAGKGIKGLKIDFLHRDDQLMNEFCYSCAEIMARYHILLDFHGCPKPTGLNVTFPNVVSFEGVNGLEQMKWSPVEYDQVSYDTFLPFIRQIAGPMDYTPGAMRNANKKDYHPSYNHPMSQGTRCRQLALYILFFSPLGILADSPVLYQKNIECLNFISSLPTCWDETIVIDGRIGEYLILARRKGEEWYVGGITNWCNRKFKVSLDFLSKSLYTSEIFTDGINVDKDARDYCSTSMIVSKSSELDVEMTSGGGFVMKFIPK